MNTLYSTPQKVILGCLITLLFCIGIWSFVISYKDSLPVLSSRERNFFLIDINTASFKELCLIPYISSNIAQQIINKREEKGCIKDLNELLSIKGIGPAKLKKIRKYLTN